ncbi:hypothetical protein WJX73_004359 [Symbiochloris irregularis]|uniref:Protein arginine methyltransferase NDUFAF7 n=1 Tax=Symbiochloris irregularis TaxID=706552 RepID=A0AAW1NEC9_9CHLO
MLARQVQTRCFSTRASSAQLLRDFLHQSLYQGHTGYFGGSSLPVGTLTQPILFNDLSSKSVYQQLLHEQYRKLQASWLTPSEIFSPHWGTGRLALDILNWLRREAQPLYATATYRSIELSPGLASVQQTKLHGDNYHRQHFQVHRGDAMLPGSWGPASSSPCFIIMMEVLDNCPHDKVVRQGPAKGWQQVVVARDQQGHPAEVLQPLTDDLILECMTAASWEFPPRPWWRTQLDSLLGGPPDGEVIFLPTTALRLLQTICAVRPCHSIIAADFDELPDVVIQGLNAPLVAATAAGVAKDFDTYLDSNLSGNCDIFFPTNFSALSQLYHKAAGSSVQTEASHLKTSDFMTAHADTAATRLRDGYNPLLEDFSNSSFFLAQSLQAGH